MKKTKDCLQCGTNVDISRYLDRIGGCTLYDCPLCGRYVIADNTSYKTDKIKTKLIV